MDQNRIPSSSPMQHHNESCGRPTSSSSSSDPNTASSSSAIPRPSSSHQSPAPKSNSLTITSTPSWSSTSTWPGEDESGTTHAPSIASSSRLPSTHFFPGSDAPLSAVEDVDAYLELEPPGSALLTCEPLNRSSSTQPSPNLSSRSIIPSPLPIANTFKATSSSSSRPSTGKRRVRASSLPTAEPVFKRRRFAPDAPTPSEEFARTYASRRKDSTRLTVQQARARELGEKLLAGRHLKGGCRPGEQIVVASHLPPINNKTLRSLDAHEILKQPQLRHDLLFDTLAFRPINSSSAATYSDTLMSGAEMAAAESPGNLALASSSRGLCSVTDMYWESIETEINTGCRCTRWQIPVGSHMGVKGMKGKERMKECLCGKWRSDLSEAEWWSYQKSRMWGSRLPELIKTLREILISLMGSTTPCPNHFAHSFSREALDLHELTCPTVTHALVPQLYEALDPEFLTRRVRRKAFDFSLFEMLGEAMKVHCAPIRDGLVDDMVRTAIGSKGIKGSVAMGLRKCFDCVEIMKLDIANHQVHALRPYLWTCATQYELSAFHAHLASTSTLIPTSTTRTWVRSSSLRVLTRASPQERLHLVGNCPCRLGDNTELVLRSAADGFAGLVFGQTKSAPMNVPESLRMDIRRIVTFHSEAVDLTIIHLLTLACRDILPTVHPKLTATATHFALETITEDLDLILATHPISSGDSDGEVALQLAGRILRLDPSDRTSVPYTQADHAQLSKIAETLSRYITTHIRPDSVLFAHSFKRLEEVTRLMLTHELMKIEGEMTVETTEATRAGVAVCQVMRNGKEKVIDGQEVEDDADMMDDIEKTEGRADSVQSRVRSREIRSRPRAEEKRLARLYGLDVVFGEMKGLVKRMERIIGFNVGVFRGIYGEPGMVVGA